MRKSQPGRALFTFVRYWSRRWTGADPHRGRDVMVLEAIRALGAARRGTSVNDIARELGLDQYGASRMVAHAEQEGLVTRSRPPRVGAPSSVGATVKGERMLREAHAWQDEVFRTLTADWPEEDVETLTILMDRLVRAHDKLAHPQAAPEAAHPQAAPEAAHPQSAPEAAHPRPSPELVTPTE